MSTSSDSSDPSEAEQSLRSPASESWSQGRHQEDDITFVVVKCK